MTATAELERPCTPRKRLELAKEVDRESAALLAKDAGAPPVVPVETPRLRDFCESFVGTVVRQASQRLG